MKRFLIKIVLFALVVILVDRSFILLRNQAPKFDYDRRLEMVLEGKINRDIIILGSSRGQSDIDVQLMKDSLNTKEVFNLSYGGSTPEFQEFLLDKLLAHNKKPKLIIKLLDDDFELMNTGLDGNKKAFRIDILYSLVKYKDIREKLVERGEKNKILSKFFILHQLNRSNFNFVKRGLIDTVYGAKPSKGHNVNADWSYSEPPFYDKSKEDDTQVMYLRSLQKKCLDNGIELIFATAPVFRAPSQIWIDRMKEFTLAPTLFYQHDLKNEVFREQLNFSDLSHLNYKGAKSYTQDITSFIKEKTKFYQLKGIDTIEKATIN